MIPSIWIHEQLMFERCQEQRHAMSQLRLAAGLRRDRSRLPRRLVTTVGGFLIKLGSSLQQLEPREKQVIYDR